MGKAAFIMRVDTNSNRTSWRKLLTDGETSERRVSSLSVNPDGMYIAAVWTSQYNDVTTGGISTSKL